MPNMMDTIDGNMMATGGVATVGPVVGAGYILGFDATDVSNNYARLHAGGDVLPIGISAGQSEMSAEGVALLTAGASISFYPCSGLLYVRAKASQTFTTGLPVYCGAGGLALDGADASGQQLGIYLGTGVVTSTSDGDLVPVLCSGVGHI
jgi:hypothetical protein